MIDINHPMMSPKPNQLILNRFSAFGIRKVFLTMIVPNVKDDEFKKRSTKADIFGTTIDLQNMSYIDFFSPCPC